MNKLSYGKTMWVGLVAGVTTGMGNGSVIGAAVMSFLGRGDMFTHWGGMNSRAYNPETFTGFIDWCMILFGVAFMFIAMYAMKRHGELEYGSDSQ